MTIRERGIPTVSSGEIGDRVSPMESETPEQTARRRIVDEYFVHFDPKMWGEISHQDLVCIVEGIHEKQAAGKPKELAIYLQELDEEMPVLTHQIEGLDTTVLGFLERIARGEKNFPLQPLSANRIIPPKESIKF